MNTIALKPTLKIFKYELSDVIRSRWVLLYAFFFFVITEVLFRMGGGSAQVMLSLINAVLILIPLVSIVFGTMYLYTAREFVELMLTQPVRRGDLFFGLYLGLAIPLSLAFAIGITIPFLLHGIQESMHFQTLAMMVVSGVMLTFVFVALAFITAIRFEDRVKGLGVAIFLWLFFSIIYDGIVLGVVNAFADYPLEKPMIALSLFNPIDLARVLLLLNFDISALMGYTGAVFEQFFGSSLGITISLGALILWFALPLLASRIQFERKDF